jgi:membrane fusion protein (multidrug efflux system)
MKKLKKRLVPGLVVLFFTAIVVALFFLPKPTRSVEQPKEEKVADVKVMEIKPTLLADWIELPASVEPFVSTEVATEIAGRVDWIGPKEGSAVEKAGTPIMRIDQRTFQAQLDDAQASYNLALNECNRMEELYNEGIISKEKVDQCKATLTSSLAKLDLARLQLEKATIRAPVAGILNKVYFDVGEYVKQGDKIADIVVIDPIKVAVQVPEKDVAYINLGKTAKVLFQMTENSEYEGKISYISVMGDSATRTYNTEITVSNPSHEILPSMIGRVQILRQQIEGAITVPLFAVIPHDEFKSVFVEKDGRAEERQVKLGILEGNRVQIMDGLQPHERLIVEGHRELASGEPVRVQGVVEDVS